MKANYDVIRDPPCQKTQVNFASFKARCHLKHAEFAPRLQKCEGRVVLRSDSVKDESGFQAALAERGASASQRAAATFLDTISRRPGMAAPTVPKLLVGHTQLKLGQKWKHPVVFHESNLASHPLARLLSKRKVETCSVT